MKTAIKVISFLAALTPTVAAAHPGHGSTESSQPIHYLLDHPLLAAGAVAALVGVFAVRRIRQSR